MTMPRSVLVVGGGVAGLVAARSLAMQGYEVSLFEDSVDEKLRCCRFLRFIVRIKISSDIDVDNRYQKPITYQNDYRYCNQIR